MQFLFLFLCFQNSSAVDSSLRVYRRERVKWDHQLGFIDQHLSSLLDMLKATVQHKLHGQAINIIVKLQINNSVSHFFLNDIVMYSESEIQGIQCFPSMYFAFVCLLAIVLTTLWSTNKTGFLMMNIISLHDKTFLDEKAFRCFNAAMRIFVSMTHRVNLVDKC